MSTFFTVWPIAGMWAGPSYAGGWNLPPGSDQQGENFRRLYGDIALGGTNPGVLPRLTASFTAAFPQSGCTV